MGKTIKKITKASGKSNDKINIGLFNSAVFCCCCFFLRILPWLLRLTFISDEYNYKWEMAKVIATTW